MKKLIVLYIILIISQFCYADKKPLNIVMILWRGETKAEQGFTDRMSELGYQVNYTIFNAEQSRTNLGLFLRNEFTSNLDSFDYVYSFGTTATQMTKFFLDNRIPHIFNIVTAPVEANIVANMEASGENITGISHRVSVDIQAKAILEIKNIKKLGFFLNPREDNSKITLKNAKAAGKKYDVEIVSFRTAPNQNSLEDNLNKLINNPEQVDAVYFPLDSFLVSNAEIIGKKMQNSGIMSIGAIKEYIENGVLIGIIPDYYHLGEIAAEIINRNQNGENFENIPIFTVKNHLYIINETTKNKLGIDIPDNIMSKSVIVE